MVNKVILIGNVGNDPEVKQMPSGDKVANFSLATSEKWKDKSTGEQKEKTEWHRIVVFGNLCSVIESYVRKGSKLYIEGRVETRKWQDQSGQDKYSTEIVLRGFGGNMVMLDSKSNGASQNATVQTAQAQPIEDEIPF